MGLVATLAGVGFAAGTKDSAFGKLRRAARPAVARAERRGVGSVAGQCGVDRAAQILVERARAIADDVAGAGNRKGGDRGAAAQRLDDDEAEGVGAAGKDEDVGACIGRRERFAAELAEEQRAGMLRLECGERGAIADDDLCARAVACPETRRCSSRPRHARHRAGSAAAGRHRRGAARDRRGTARDRRRAPTSSSGPAPARQARAPGCASRP